MKLLLSNDDGIFAEGITALAKALRTDHEIMISAPDTERSCVSRGMTLTMPLRAKRVFLSGLEEIPAYAVSGTPVDCIRLGLGNLFPKPDMVISGINLGPNLGTDVLYSGTVAAAHEAALLGVPAIALSMCAYQPKHFATAAFFAPRAVEYLEKNRLPFGTVLSVNIPDLPLSDIRGIRVVPAGVVKYKLEFVAAKDPAGNPCYWPPHGRIPLDPTVDTDDRWANEGYVTITPLTYDLTDYATLNKLSKPDWVR